MRNFFLISSLVLVLGCEYTFAREEKKTISTYLLEEKINGIIFVYKNKNVNGVLSEEWLIEGALSDKQEYDSAILDAEIEERRAERRMAYELQVQNQAFENRVYIEGSKRMLGLLIKSIEESLIKFDRYSLNSYMVFDEETSLSANEFYLIKDIVARVRGTLYSDESDFLSKSQLDSLIDLIEKYPEKLKVLFRLTLENAIKTCDDTKLLKKLLEMTSS